MSDIHVTFTEAEAGCARHAILNHCETLTRVIGEHGLSEDWLEVIRKRIDTYKDAAAAIANAQAAQPLASRKSD